MTNKGRTDVGPDRSGTCPGQVELREDPCRCLASVARAVLSSKSRAQTVRQQSEPGHLDHDRDRTVSAAWRKGDWGRHRPEATKGAHRSSSGRCDVLEEPRSCSQLCGRSNRRPKPDLTYQSFPAGMRSKRFLGRTRSMSLEIADFLKVWSPNMVPDRPILLCRLEQTSRATSAQFDESLEHEPRGRVATGPSVLRAWDLTLDRRPDDPRPYV